jgi:hypothetical protein
MACDGEPQDRACHLIASQMEQEACTFHKNHSPDLIPQQSRPRFCDNRFAFAKLTSTEKITFFCLKLFQITQDYLASRFRKFSLVFPFDYFCGVTNV